jgi:hypothetical protein
MKILEKIALRLWGRIPRDKELKEEIMRKDRKKKEEKEGELLSKHLRDTSKFN